MKKFFSALVLLCCLPVVAVQAVDIYPVTDYQAPDFELRGIDGQKHKLSDYRGKVVFLNLWATWCQPCREEMPEMEKLNKEFKDKDFVMVAVGLDQAGIPTIKPFIRKNKFSFTVLADPGGRLILNLYRMAGKPIPATFIIGKDGIIRENVYGMRDWASEENLARFNKLIAE